MNPDITNDTIILFDGICNLCNGTVNLIIDHDPEFKFKFAALQSPAGAEVLSAVDLNSKYDKSIVLILEGKIYYKSRAILEIAKRLKGFWKIFYVFIIIPSPILNFFYDIVARYRYRIFGKRETCRVPTPELLKRFLGN